MLLDASASVLWWLNADIQTPPSGIWVFLTYSGFTGTLLNVVLPKML